MKYLILLFLLTYNLSYSQSDSLNKKKIDSNSYSSLTRTKFSIGVGYVINKTSDLYTTSFSLEYFNSGDNFATDIGLDLYSGKNSYAPSINFNVLYNFAIPSKSRIVEFFTGPGLELVFFGVNFSGIARMDINITKEVSIGVTFKQRMFLNKSASSPFESRVIRINLSSNF